jgi:hypothetical protein
MAALDVPSMMASFEMAAGGVTKVFVRKALSMPAGFSGAAWLPQNFESLSFSD